MNSAKKVASGVIWSFVVNVVNALYGFISVPILLHYFGKSEYGIIGLALSVNVYMQLMDLGLNSTNVRFFASWLAKGDKEKTNQLFQTSLAFYGIVGLINALILIAVSCFSVQMFHLNAEQDAVLKTLFYILAVSAIFSWYTSSFDQLVRATENVAWMQRRTLICKVMQIAILFATVYGHLSISWYFFLITFVSFLIVPLTVKKIRLEISNISFLPKFDGRAFREILPYSLNIFSFSIFQFSFYNLRPVFLGMRGSVESVADYQVLNGIMGMVSMFSGAFLGVLLPSTSKIVAQGNKDAYYRVAYAGTKYITIVTCFCAFGLMSVAPEIITLYVGKSFLSLMPWFYLWIFCSLGVHNQAISSLILSGSDIRAITYSSVAASLLGIAASWFLIPYYEVGGVVVALAVYLVVQLVFYYVYYWPRKMQIDSRKVFFSSFLPYVVTGVVLGTLTNRFLSVTDNTLVCFLVKGFTFAISFAVITYLLLDKDDRDFIFSVVKRQG